MERDYAEAERRLRSARSERLNDTGVGGPAAILDGYTFPKAWFEGLIARGRGDGEAAERSFAATQRIVQADLLQAGEDAKITAMLGLVYALRGQKDEAIAAGRRAVQLLPVSRDAYDGPLIALKLALIYARTGETDCALELLDDLMKLPNGPTPGTLRVEAEWDPLRSDPRFQALAK
jgi:tetratricopeptide (TPR) repeat protein